MKECLNNSCAVGAARGDWCPSCGCELGTGASPTDGEVVYLHETPRGTAGTSGYNHQLMRIVEQQQTQMSQMNARMENMQNSLQQALSGFVGQQQSEGNYKNFLRMVDLSIKESDPYAGAGGGAAAQGQARIVVQIPPELREYAGRAVSSGQYAWADHRCVSLVRK